MIGHCLTEIDLAARTAVCSVCGPTEIHVSQPRTENPAKVCCVQRFRETRLYMQAVRQRNSAGIPRHRLSEIDAEKHTAVCAICGPTAVYRSQAKGRIAYRCANRARMANPREGGVHRVNPYARVHILSQIDEENNSAVCIKCGPVRVDWNTSPSLQVLAPDPERVQENTRIVTEYKRRQACKRCGSMAIVGPDGFGFFEMHLPKAKRIAALLKQASPEELPAELDRRDLYCIKCLGLSNKCHASNTPVPEFRPFPAFF